MTVGPGDVKRAQHRIASTNQQRANMDAVWEEDAKKPPKKKNTRRVWEAVWRGEMLGEMVLAQAQAKHTGVQVLIDLRLTDRDWHRGYKRQSA